MPRSYVWFPSRKIGSTHGVETMTVALLFFRVKPAHQRKQKQKKVDANMFNKLISTHDWTTHDTFSIRHDNNCITNLIER